MSVRVYIPDNPFVPSIDVAPDQWDYCDAESGQTLREICGDSEIVALCNGREMSAFSIENARLKNGNIVYVRPVPQAALALAAASVAASAAAGAATSTLAIAGFTALSVGLSVAATLIQPTPSQHQGTAAGGFNRLAALTGSQNQVAAFEPIPRLFGRHRYFPPIPMTAQPYTEQAGDDQYLRMMVCLGEGPLDIGGHKVGIGYEKITQDTHLSDTLGQAPILIDSTDIHEYDDLEFEIGRPDQMTLYTDQVIEKQPGWTTESDASGYGSHDNPTVTDNQSTIRTTDTGATEISVDLSGRLYTIDSDGDFSRLVVNWDIEWRRNGTNDAWQKDSFSMTGYGTTARKNYRITGLDGESAYDVRLTRVSTYFSNLEGSPSSEVTWTALRTVRDRRAFDVDGTIVMDLRIRATDQLNGQIKKLSVLPTSVLKVWDGSQWTEQATRSPAWAFASVLTDGANRRPEDLSVFDAASLKAWADETEDNDRHYDIVYDNNSTTLKRINEIASAGRATWNIESDTSVSIVRDVRQSLERMMISPRNSWGYTYHLNAFDPPHAMRVRYIDSETWENTEVTVYDDGFNESNATRFETIDAPGATEHDQAWKHGRYELARRRLRDIEKHTFNQDVQHLHYRRGDRLSLSNDVILVGLGYGRVVDVETDGEGNVTALTCDAFLPMPDTNTAYGVKIQRLNGSVVVRTVQTDVPGGYRVVLTETIDHVPLDSHITFGESGKISTDVKCVSITPQGDLKAQIVCEPYAPEILDAETGTIPAPPDDITVPPDYANQPPAPPTIERVVSDETAALKNDDGSRTWRVQVDVSANGGRVGTETITVQARLTDATVYQSQAAQDGTAYFTGFNPGDTLTIRARSRSETGNTSDWVYRNNYTVVGRQPPKPTDVDVQRGTFEIKLSPRGGPPSATYEFWRGQPNIATADIESQATRLGQGQSYNDGDREPETTYGYYIRTVNAYGVSDWYTLVVTTKNEPDAILKNIAGQISDTELSDQLNSEIGKISGDGPGSVSDQINDRAEQIEDDLDQRADDLNNRLGDLRNDTTGIDLVIPPGQSPGAYTQTLLRESGLQDGFDAGIQNEAQQRAQALLDQKNELTTDISNTREQLESEDESLASAISSLAAGSGEQFDVATIWYYDDDLAGWTGGTMANGFLVPDNGEAPFVVSPMGVGADGDTRRYVKARIKRHGSPTWAGKIYWKNAGDADWSGPATLDEPAFQANGVTTISWEDIPWSGTIDQIRVRLTDAESDTDGVDIDWLAIGRPTPGASTAALQRERSARIRDNQARVEDNETLAAQIRGDYDGDDPSQLSRGLIFEQRQVDISAREAISQRVDSVQSEVGNNAAAINSEEQTRADETSALSQRATGLESRIRAFRLKQEYGFETGEAGQQGAPDGWTIAGDQSSLGYADSFGESDYGSALAYGATNGTPGAWSATKRITLAKGGADLSLKVRTKVLSGHVYTLLTVYDANGEQINQFASNEQSTDYEGVLSLTVTMPDNAHFVDLSLRASAKQ